MDRALLIGIILPKVFDGDVRNHLDELKMLAQTANVETLGEITQKVQKINPAFILVKEKHSKLLIKQNY